MCALAPAKINLGLFVGPVRPQDGRHELASAMQSISLADELTLEPAPAGVTGDEIVCPGVPGAPTENLAAAALRLFREETGWDVGPLRLSIVKRIPVAGGLAGGSADAAAALRLARHASGLGTDELLAALGRDWGRTCPRRSPPGAGWPAARERLRELPAPIHPFGVLVLPVAAGLSTAAVYERADEIGTRRTPGELAGIAGELERAFELGAAAPGAQELLHNDLQAAAISPCRRSSRRWSRRWTRARMRHS